VSAADFIAPLDANSRRPGRSRSFGVIRAGQPSGGGLSEAFPVAGVAVLVCCTVLARDGLRPGPVYSSADETVAAVRVLVEELCLPAGIPSPVLGEEDGVRVIRPP